MLDEWADALLVPRSVPRRPGAQLSEPPERALAPPVPLSVDARMSAARSAHPAPLVDYAAASPPRAAPPPPIIDDRPASPASSAQLSSPPRTPPTPVIDSARRYPAPAAAWPADAQGDGARTLRSDEAVARAHKTSMGSAGRSDRWKLLSAAHVRSDDSTPPARARRDIASVAADARLSFLSSLPAAPLAPSPPPSAHQPTTETTVLRYDALVPLAQRLEAYRASGRVAAAARAEEARAPSIAVRLLGVVRAAARWQPMLDARVRLWSSSIRSVQGQFGSGIGDFFELWRDVVFLDALAATLWLGLVIVPFALCARGARHGGGADAGGGGGGGVAADAAHAPGAAGVTGVTGATGDPGVTDQFRWLFYGGYPRWVGAYDLGEAYTLAALGSFALILWGTLRIMLANLIARADGEAQSAASGGGGCCGARRPAAGDEGIPFAAELFCAVDWKCTDPAAVRVGVHTALLALSERLHADRLREAMHAATWKERARASAKHVAGGIVSLMLVCGYLVALVYACDKDVALRLRAVSEFATPTLLAILKLLTPRAVRFVIALEGHADEGEITKQICVRVYVLKMANLAVALYGVHDALHLSACPNTTSGEFMLRLYATDLAFSLSSAWLVGAFAARSAGARVDYDISSPTIDLFYRQEMALLGVYSCPLILCVFIAGETVHFASTVALLRTFYRRPLRPFALAQGEHFFHSLSALTTSIGLVGTVWLMRQPPLGACGPHEQHIPLVITIDALRERREPLIDRTLGLLCAPATYAGLALVLAARLAFRAATASRLAAEVASLQAELRAEKATLRALIVEQQLELAGCAALASVVSARPRVTVIGAGVSGLCCARTLSAAGVDVRVLDRADGVGGRVRSDVVDGFILDRGFQVFLTEYPEPRAVLDYEALELCNFLPGALVQIGQERHLVADPFRRPQDLLRGALAPIGSLIDKASVAIFALWQFVQPIDAIFAKPDRPTLTFLRDDLRVSDVMVTRFFRPFYQGIFLAPLDEQSSRMFEFVFKMFTLGVAALPARGIGAVAQQLADALPQGTVELRTAAVGVTPTSVTVRDVGAGGALGAAARTVESDAVVIAVERPALPLIDGAADAVATDGGRASVALYFAFRGPPPIAEPILVLNGQAGPALAKSSTNGPFVNNVCFPSQVAPSYAPAGQSLASVTVIGNPDVDDATLEAAVRAELGGWFGRECVSEWRHLRTYRVPYAQPAQTGASGTFTRPARLANGLYRCGDHTSSPTLNGAMESGRLAAEAVLADLRR